MTLLITNIGELSTCDPTLGEGPTGVIRDAALVIEDGRVAWVGSAKTQPAADESLDAQGSAVLPGFVDSHAHLIFAGERSAEFAARMAGESYQAGGIRTTVAATRQADDETLRANAARLVAEAQRQGTTTIEIKSGYGLTVADEARSLRIAREFTDETTYLGAHVVPSDVDVTAYVELAAGEMLTAAAPYAKWADVFCERGAFDEDAARTILGAAKKHGLGLRVHANQLGEGPGVRLAVELGAASADHCTYLSQSDVDDLASGDTVATLLPGVEFSTRQPYPDARRLIDAGATVAIACDCNPGSCYSSSMPLMIALAVREMRMTVPEAILAATLGGAKALRRNDVGHLAPGARADLSILDAPSALHLAYRPGVPLVREVLVGGVKVPG